MIMDAGIEMASFATLVVRLLGAGGQTRTNFVMEGVLDR